MKKKLWRRLYLAADLLLMLAVAALVPLNLFVYPFPEWVMLLAIVLLVIVNGGFVEKFDPRKLYKVLLIIAAVPVISFSLIGSYCNPYWNSLLLRESGPTEPYDELMTYEQAKEDMDYMMRYFQKCHPIFLERSQGNLQVKYQDALERLGNAHEITVNDVRTEMQRIFYTLNDAHTTAWGKWEDERYLRTFDARKSAGWELASVNGTLLETMLKEKKTLFSYEVESWGMKELKNNLFTLSGLDYLGIDPNGVKYTWQNNSGMTETETYTVEDFLLYDDYMEHNRAFRSDDTEVESFVSYTIDERKSLALLTLKACDYSQEYIDCLKKMFTEVKDKNIRNVAVDLRGNGGGSSMVANEFIRYLNVSQFRTDKSKWRLGFFNIPFNDNVTVNHKYDGLTFEGSVFVLTDTSSFSSAMLFAEYIKDNDLGTLIGEPPGNIPNGYGDVAVFQLPNSGLYFQVSTKKFSRIDGDTTEKLVMPDIQCTSAKALNVLYQNLER